MFLRMDKKLQLLSILYIGVCLLGLLYQVFLVLSEFFKYGVSSSINLATPNDYKIPSLSSCFRFEEIFNYDEFNAKYVSNPFILNLSDPLAVYFAGIKLPRRVTIRDIYEFTPTAKSMIDTCEIRDAETYQYKGFYESGLCDDKISVEKIYHIWIGLLQNDTKVELEWSNYLREF